MATNEDQIKVHEKEYAHRAMIVGDMFYKMECLKQEMAAINQKIVEIKGAKEDGEQV